MIDLVIVMLYFTTIMIVALRGQESSRTSITSYFLSNRSLRWPSIAISTIATNVQGYQFLGMMGSAYLFGLAQANLEINAVQGLLIAAFVFVPIYLRERVMTITQFIKKRVGPRVSFMYVISNILLFSTITLGAALFWGAYAAELVFSDLLSVLHEDRMARLSILIVGLGVFSAIYTYLGGLNAVVKTDIVQFGILMLGGITILFTAVHHLGGWTALYSITGDRMHLHLPADHDTLPWTHMLGLFFLNINYWCANQTIMQRSLAARSLREAQIGLMVGGLMKYIMAIIIIVPGIALYGILKDQGGLEDPDTAFPYLVTEFLPSGIQGIILCALFASLMSTVDSTYNSLATMWSVDIYKVYIHPDASSAEMISAGRKMILVTLITGIVVGLILMYLKLERPTSAFTHTLNQIRYFVNCAIVVIIIACALYLRGSVERATLIGAALTVPLQFLTLHFLPELNYFLRAFLVIVLGLGAVFALSSTTSWRLSKDIWIAHDKSVQKAGWWLLVSLVIIHLIWH